MSTARVGQPEDGPTVGGMASVTALPTAEAEPSAGPAVIVSPKLEQLLAGAIVISKDD
jgi:hypothetical protein